MNSSAFRHFNGEKGGGSLVPRLVGLALLAWSGWFLNSAFRRWRFEHFYDMAGPPFIPIELVEHYRQAFDWQTPLLMALLPPAVVGLAASFRWLFRHSA